MSNDRFNEDEIAGETFKLFMRAFTLKNSCFSAENCEKLTKIKKFKQHRKKFYILFCINSAKDCTLSDLEGMLMENRSTVSAAVTKLYLEGYISKNQPEKGDDGRKVYFKVTEKGKELLQYFTGTFEDDVKSFYSGLSDEGKWNFANGVVSLNKVFD